LKTADFISSIGNTPLLTLDALSKIAGSKIYGKAEFMNPGGSVKDRAALGMIEDAEKKGLLKKGDLIVEGTAGNTGIALALIGNIKGYRTKFVIADCNSKEKIDTIRGMGAEVVVVPFYSWPDPKNYQKIAERLAKEEGGYFINQFDNLSNLQAHYSTTAPEIWNQTDGKVTTFVCALGSGGTYAGVSRYLKEKNSKVHLGFVDPAGSAMHSYFTSGKAALSEGDTISEGIGQGRVTANVEPSIRPNFSAILSDALIVGMAQTIVRMEGLFLGGSAAANVCGAYLAAKTFGPNQKIVTILCDSGQKYVSKIYNEDFLKQRGLHDVPTGDRLFKALDELSRQMPKL
jgi:cysteine synthase